MPATRSATVTARRAHDSFTKNLTSREKAGLGAGLAVCIIALIVLGVFFYKHRHQPRYGLSKQQTNLTDDHDDEGTKTELHGQSAHEMGGAGTRRHEVHGDGRAPVAELEHA